MLSQLREKDEKSENLEEAEQEQPAAAEQPAAEPAADQPAAEEPAPVPEPQAGPLLPLSLRRIHEKLSKDTELLKLHIKHYHMSTTQFRRRTSQLKLP